MVGETSPPASTQGIFRSPLDPSRPPNIECTAACFAAGHRALYDNDLVNMDVSCKKLCRQIVDLPSGARASLEWHQILDPRHEPVGHFAARANVKSWPWCGCAHA